MPHQAETRQAELDQRGALLAERERKLDEQACELDRRAAEIEERRREVDTRAVRLAASDQQPNDELDAATDPTEFPIPREEVISLSPELIIDAVEEPSAGQPSPPEDSGEE